MRGDFHTHTLASDGVMTPDELLNEARKHGLTHLAITDHDTFDSSFYAKDLNLKDIEIIIGLELSTANNGESVHILGYFKNKEDARKIFPALEKTRNDRRVRSEKMLDLLEKEGIKLDRSFLRKGNIVTRGEISREIMRQGYPYDNKTIFEKFLGNGCPCYIEAAKVKTADGIKLILEAGGFPVLAHPALLTKNDSEAIVKMGVKGIEASYGSRLSEEPRFRALAKKYNLVVTGGTDFHKFDDGHHVNIGTHYIQDEDIIKFKEALYGSAKEASSR